MTFSGTVAAFPEFVTAPRHAGLGAPHHPAPLIFFPDDGQVWINLALVALAWLALGLAALRLSARAEKSRRFDLRAIREEFLPATSRPD